MRQAYALLLALPGAPCIDHGVEIGMAGGHDPDNRGAFPRHAPKRWDGELEVLRAEGRSP